VIESANGAGESRDMVELRMQARAENLALARLALAGMAGSVGAPHETVADLKLAVTEACTNVIQHAYGSGDGTDEIVVRYAAKPGAVEVEVEDSGNGFEPEGERREGPGPGLGLMIIRELTDEVTIATGNAGSRIRFVKRFSPES
jgi:serine/threonine-protein kinase RsbW